MSTARKTPAALLASPVFAGSIAVLIINDHVVKSAWPGFVTGKLSDVAGCIMVAVLLAAVLRRPGAACVVTALAFAALKVVPMVPIWVAPMLGGVTRTDPTDLVALVALFPVWAWLSGRGPHAVRSGVAQERVDPRWLLPVQLLALSAATLATTATSCASTHITPIEVSDGSFVVADGERVFGSADGGWTWALIDAVPPTELGTEACLEDGTCFSLSGESVLEHEPEGASSIAFAYTPAELAAQERNADSICDVDPHDGFVAIAAMDSAGGQHVVVTMNSQGVLVRTPDGTWSGRPVDGFGPISTDTFDLGGASGRVLLAVPLLVAVIAIAIAFGLDRRSPRKRAAAMTAIAVVVCVGSYVLLFVVSFARVGADFDRALVKWAAVTAAISIVLLSVEAWWLRRPTSAIASSGSELPPPCPDQRAG